MHDLERVITRSMSTGADRLDCGTMQLNIARCTYRARQHTKYKMTLANVVAIMYAVVVLLAVSTLHFMSTIKRMLTARRRGCSSTLRQSVQRINVSYVIVYVSLMFLCRVRARSVIDV